MANGIVLSESPENEIYGNNIHDVTRGIYFVNPATPDDGVTQNNNAHDNMISSATYGIMTINSPINTVTNNAIDSASVTYEYYLATDSKLVIGNQAFSDDRIRAGGGSNPIEIKNSGLISVDGSTATDTTTTPYTDTLSNEVIIVKSVTQQEPPPPEPEPDTTAPLVKITDPANNANVLLGTLTVSGTSSDNEGGSGVKTVQVRVHKWVNGQLGDLYKGYTTATPNAPGDWSTWSIGLDFSETGSFRIQARATDNAGNNAWNSIILTVSESQPAPQPQPTPTTDTTAPDVQITSPSTGSSVPAGTVHVEGTAVDNEGGSGIKTVQVRVHKWVDGTLGDQYLGYQTATVTSEGWATWSIDLSIPDPGSYRVQARATDNAGNQDWHSIYVTVQ